MSCGLAEGQFTDEGEWEDEPTLLSDHEGGDLADDELGSISSQLVTSPVLINEYRQGAGGWVELYNPTNFAVDLYTNPTTCFWVDDGEGGTKPKLITDSNVRHLPGNNVCRIFGRPDTCARIAPKERVWVDYGGINTASADKVRVLYSAYSGGSCSESTFATGEERVTTGGSNATTCFARQPDGAAWGSQAVACTPGEPNAGGTVCANGLVVGSACNANPCRMYETVNASCNCAGGAVAPIWAEEGCIRHACTDGVGWESSVYPDGTVCNYGGSGRVCRAGACVPVATVQTTVVINEFTPGSSGWVELFNKGTAGVDVSGWSVTDATASAGTTKKFPAGSVVPPGGYVTLSYGSINTSSVDHVTLKTTAGVTVETKGNYFTSGSNAGKCFGRLPDGGEWSPQALVSCSKGAKNVVPAPATTCAAGTWGGVTFTDAQACKAVAFLNGARFSQLHALGPGERRTAFDCGPGNTCTQQRAWKSLEQLSVSQNTNACSFKSWDKLKTSSAQWSDDGVHTDTVVNVWANRNNLTSREVDLGDVLVVEQLPRARAEDPNCALVKDSAGSANYVAACAWVNPFADATVTPWPVGQRLRVRGYFSYDSTMKKWVVLFGKQQTAEYSCGMGQ